MSSGRLRATVETVSAKSLAEELGKVKEELARANQKLDGLEKVQAEYMAHLRGDHEKASAGRKEG